MNKPRKTTTAAEKSIPLDVAVIGGGPAGVSAAIELSRSSNLKIALFESDTELGGVPRTSHLFCFGFRDLKGVYTGRAYASRLERSARKTSVEIHTRSTVLNIIPGNPGEMHRLEVLSPQGLKTYACRFVLLATGCVESSRPARVIPGTRPAGIMTTGTLMELVNLHHVKPGKRALIIGSEHVAVETLLTLRRAGTAIAGLVEEDQQIQTYPLIAKAMSFLYRFPIYHDCSVNAILGDKRVQGVELTSRKSRSRFLVECDTVILTGKFRAYSPLIYDTPIEYDPATFGPAVDMNLMTSVPNIFCAGNILRGAEMHDLCALEGRQAARNIVRSIESVKVELNEWISINGEYPVRYVVPQKITATEIRPHRFPLLCPGVTIQVAHTLKNPVLEAVSNDQSVWESSFSRLLGNTRILLPVHKFDWRQVDTEKGITLKVKGAATGAFLG